MEKLTMEFIKKYKESPCDRNEWIDASNIDYGNSEAPMICAYSYTLLKNMQYILALNDYLIQNKHLFPELDVKKLILGLVYSDKVVIKDKCYVQIALKEGNCRLEITDEKGLGLIFSNINLKPISYVVVGNSKVDKFLSDNNIEPFGYDRNKGQLIKAMLSNWVQTQSLYKPKELSFRIINVCESRLLVKNDILPIHYDDFKEYLQEVGL